MPIVTMHDAKLVTPIEFVVMVIALVGLIVEGAVAVRAAVSFLSRFRITYGWL